jgi:hypothetical protein
MAAASGRETWIDMETHVRTKNGLALDLAKVNQVLSVVQNTCSPALEAK